MIADSVRSATLLYEVGGLRVRSPFPVGHLRLSANATDGRTDIAVSLDDSPGPAPERRIFQWTGRYGLCLWRTQDSWQFTSLQDGSFLLSDDGSTIRCFRPDTQSPPSVRISPARQLSAPTGLQYVLAGRVLPRAGMLHGRMGLHAASVSDGESAMLILGATHAGKSTLSAALHQRLGWQVLADDISLIAVDDGAVRCFRMGAGTYLRSGALAGLHISVAASQHLPHQRKKRWCAADTESASNAVPVRAIVFLAEDGQEGIRLSPLSPSHALIKANIRQILFNPADLGARSARMMSLARVVERVPAYEFFYPRSFDYLPAVVARLRECLDQGVA